MKQESGRSLIETIGVMALGAVMAAGVFAAYNTIKHRTQRAVAVAHLEEIVKNTRLLLGARDDYAGVSVAYLVKAGALKDDDSPIGGDEWEIRSSPDGHEFSINLTDLSDGDCEYLATVKLPWAARVRVNDADVDPVSGAYCLSSGHNKVSVIID